METSTERVENPERQFEINLIQEVFQRPCLYFNSSSHYGCRMSNKTSWMKIARTVQKPIAECKDKWFFLFQTFLHFSRLERGIGYELLCLQWCHYKFFKKMQSQMAKSYTEVLSRKVMTKPDSPRESAERERLIHQIEVNNDELMNPSTSCRRRQEIWTDIAFYLNERFPIPQRCVIEWQMIWWELKQEYLSPNTKAHDHSQEQIRVLKIFGIDSLEDHDAALKLSRNCEFNENVTVSFCLNCPSTKVDLIDGLCSKCYEPCLCEICLKGRPVATLSTKTWGIRANKLIPKVCRKKDKVRFCLRCQTDLKQKASWLWKICRVCGESKHPLENLMHSSYEHLRDTFHSATGFRFHLSDGLPCFACIKCRDELMDFIRVYLTFSNTQKKLLDIQKKCLVGDGPISKTSFDTPTNSKLDEKPSLIKLNELSRKQSKRLKLLAEKNSFREERNNPFEVQNDKSESKNERIFDGRKEMPDDDKDVIKASDSHAISRDRSETDQYPPKLRVYSRKRLPVQEIPESATTAKNSTTDTYVSSSEETKEANTHFKKRKTLNIEDRPTSRDSPSIEIEFELFDTVTNVSDSSSEKECVANGPDDLVLRSSSSKSSSYKPQTEAIINSAPASKIIKSSTVQTQSQCNRVQPKSASYTNLKQQRSESHRFSSAEKLLPDLGEISLTPIEKVQELGAIPGKLKTSNTPILGLIREREELRKSLQKRPAREMNTNPLLTTNETDESGSGLSVNSRNIRTDIISVLSSLEKSSELSITVTKPAEISAKTDRRVTRSMEKSAISLTSSSEGAKLKKETVIDHRHSPYSKPCTKITRSTGSNQSKMLSLTPVSGATPTPSSETSTRVVKLENEHTEDFVNSSIEIKEEPTTKNCSIPENNPTSPLTDPDESNLEEESKEFNSMPYMFLPDESTKNKSLELYKTLFLDDEEDDVDDENVAPLNTERSCLQIKSVYSLNETYQID